MERTSKRGDFFRIPLSLVVRSASDKEGFEGWTENVSTKGLFVQSVSEASLGARLFVNVSFPGLLTPMDFVGHVVWKRPQSTWLACGMGIKLESKAERFMATVCALQDSRRVEPKLDFKILTLGFGTWRPQKGSRIQVFCTQTPMDALSALASFRPNLIVSESLSSLPECLQTLKNIRDLVDTPVFVMASGDLDTDARVINGGAAAVVGLGLRMEHLLNTICVLRERVL